MSKNSGLIFGILRNAGTVNYISVFFQVSTMFPLNYLFFNIYSSVFQIINGSNFDLIGFIFGLSACGS